MRYRPWDRDKRGLSYREEGLESAERGLYNQLERVPLRQQVIAN
jgi:hypothetical protein